MTASWHEYRRDGRYSLVPYETFGNRTMFFWQGWRPFLFRKEQEAKAATAKEGQPTGTKIYSTITHIRGMLSVETLPREACAFSDRFTWHNAADETERNRFAIYYVPSRSKEEASRSDLGRRSFQVLRLRGPFLVGGQPWGIAQEQLGGLVVPLPEVQFGAGRHRLRGFPDHDPIAFLYRTTEQLVTDRTSHQITTHLCVGLLPDCC